MSTPARLLLELRTNSPRDKHFDAEVANFADYLWISGPRSFHTKVAFGPPVNSLSQSMREERIMTLVGRYR